MFVIVSVILSIGTESGGGPILDFFGSSFSFFSICLFNQTIILPISVKYVDSPPFSFNTFTKTDSYM